MCVCLCFISRSEIKSFIVAFNMAYIQSNRMDGNEERERRCLYILLVIQWLMSVMARNVSACMHHKLNNSPKNYLWKLWNEYMDIRVISLKGNVKREMEQHLLLLSHFFYKNVPKILCFAKVCKSMKKTM